MGKNKKLLDTHDLYVKNTPIFSLVIRTAGLIWRTKEHVKCYKNKHLPKPPYILISNHASFMDYYTCIKATLPHQPYWVSTIEEYIDKNWIFRRIGIIPKRKYTNDPISAEMMLDVLTKRKKILIVFHEGRYSLVGCQEKTDDGIARMAKMAQVPVVYVKNNGHYLRDPVWGDHKIRKVRPIRSSAKVIITKQDAMERSFEELKQIIKDSFTYDEYAYQLENNIKITYKNRAKYLERILYKCPHCGTEFEMVGDGTTIKCNHCGIEYSYNENGSLSALNGEKTIFKSIVDWYHWEKEEAFKEVNAGIYRFEDKVRVEQLLYVGTGFVNWGDNFTLIQDNNGIHLKGTKDNGEEFTYERTAASHFALHVEYDYKGKGGCCDLSTQTETYFVYPINKYHALTKMHFATEAIYELAKSKRNQ